MFTRLPLSLLFGTVLTLLMFWLMSSLVSRPSGGEAMREATRIEFTRMRKDTDVASKREEKVERERPPPAPEVPKMQFQTSGVDSNGHFTRHQKTRRLRPSASAVHSRRWSKLRQAGASAVNVYGSTISVCTQPSANALPSMCSASAPR